MRNGLTEERVRGAVGTVLVDWVRADGTIMKGLTGESGGGEVSGGLSACIVGWDQNFFGNQGRDGESCDGTATGCLSEDGGCGTGLSTIARLVGC